MSSTDYSGNGTLPPHIYREAVMRRLYIEERHVVGGAVSREIAYHLYARQLRGKVGVITDTPVPTLAAVRKQWIKLTRRAQRERSSTLNAVHLVEIGR